MKRLIDKPQALAATARLANVPSVVVNVCLGMAVATGFAANPQFGNLVPLPAALLVFSGICLYLSGGFFNDWADRRWDAGHRPERALPRRIFSAGSYLAAASGLGFVALCAAAAAGLQALVVAAAIEVCVLAYTWIHKRTVWSVIPMGLCRALLPVLGFAGLADVGAYPPALLAAALGLFCHIAGLSLSARFESKAPAPGGFSPNSAWLWFLAAALAMFFASRLAVPVPWWASALGVLPYAVWIGLCLTLFRKPVPVYVSNLLAGIPLVDWIVLLPPTLAHAAGGWPPAFYMACMIVAPLALLAGKALQRLAPAT